MKKAIAISFALFCAAVATVVMLLGLCLMGSLGAIIWGTTAILLTAPTAYDVIEAAWK
jgi:hypothetical protein